MDPLKSTTYFRNDGRSEPCILGEVLPPTIRQKVVHKNINKTNLLLLFQADIISDEPFSGQTVKIL